MQESLRKKLNVVLASQDFVRLFLEALDNQEMTRLQNLINGYIKTLSPESSREILSRSERPNLIRTIYDTFIDQFPNMDIRDAQDATETLIGILDPLEPGATPLRRVTVRVPVFDEYGNVSEVKAFSIPMESYKKFLEWKKSNSDVISQIDDGRHDILGIGEVVVSTLKSFSRDKFMDIERDTQDDEIIAQLERGSPD